MSKSTALSNPSHKTLSGLSGCNMVRQIGSVMTAIHLCDGGVAIWVSWCIIFKDTPFSIPGQIDAIAVRVDLQPLWKQLTEPWL